MKKAIKIGLYIIIAVLWLNVGYEYSKVAGNIRTTGKIETFTEHIISGGWELSFHKEKKEYDLTDHVSVMIIWPVLLFFSLVLWIAFMLWQLLLLLFSMVQYFYWLVFCGGLYSIIDTFGIILTIIAVCYIAYYVYRIHNKQTK